MLKKEISSWKKHLPSSCSVSTVLSFPSSSGTSCSRNSQNPTSNCSLSICWKIVGKIIDYCRTGGIAKKTKACPQHCIYFIFNSFHFQTILTKQSKTCTELLIMLRNTSANWPMRPHSPTVLIGLFSTRLKKRRWRSSYKLTLWPIHWNINWQSYWHVMSIDTLTFFDAKLTMISDCTFGVWLKRYRIRTTDRVKSGSTLFSVMHLMKAKKKMSKNRPGCHQSSQKSWV